MWAVTEVHLSPMSCDGTSESTVELRTLCSALSRAALFKSITVSTKSYPSFSIQNHPKAKIREEKGNTSVSYSAVKHTQSHHADSYCTAPHEPRYYILLSSTDMSYMLLNFSSCLSVWRLDEGRQEEMQLL